jgi:two-component system, sensor histidine kinase
MKTTSPRKLVVVIDDNPLVLEATRGLLRSWGCQVVTAESCDEAMRELAGIGRRPDLIVCDYRLPQGPTGVDTIEILRNAFQIPALLVSADVSTLQSEAGPGSYYVLSKPVNAAAFRAALIDAAVL